MSTQLQPLPDRDPLTAAEVAAALGIRHDTLIRNLRDGRVPGAFRTVGLATGRGHWRIPRAAALQVGRELGVWSE